MNLHGPGSRVALRFVYDARRAPVADDRGVVRLPPRLTAVLPYLFYWSLFAVIATALMIGLSAWATLSTGG